MNDLLDAGPENSRKVVLHIRCCNTAAANGNNNLFKLIDRDNTIKQPSEKLDLTRTSGDEKTRVSGKKYLI
jgi:hypothetical protein